MLRAFKLYTGPDNASHVLEGTIDEKDRTDVVAIHFKETPAHSSYDWHPDPEPQFVITLSGTLEFATPDGETFILRPGDVLVAVDHIGKGHKWRLIDDQPWRRHLWPLPIWSTATSTSPGRSMNVSPSGVANSSVPDSVITNCGSGSGCQSYEECAGVSLKWTATTSVRSFSSIVPSSTCDALSDPV